LGGISARADGEPGSAENPIQIADKAEFLAFASAVNGGSEFKGLSAGAVPSSCYILTNDILFDTQDDSNLFKGVGTQSRPFSGAFNGGGHRVGLYNISDTALTVFGLFSYIYGAKITDIRTENVINLPNGLNAGGIVGVINGGNVLLENCSSSVSITTSSVNGCAGGLIGRVLGGNVKINGCSYTNQVSGISYIGGIIGYAGGVASNRIMLKITPSPNVPVTGGAVKLSKIGSPDNIRIGLAVGGFGSCAAASEIGIIGCTFYADSSVSGMGQYWLADVRLIGEIGENLNVNVINLTVGAPLSAYYNGSGGFKFITASTGTYSPNIQNIPQKGNVTQNVRDAVKGSINAVSPLNDASVWFLTYGAAENQYITVKTPYSSADSDSGAIEYSDVFGLADGSLADMTMFIRLSGFTYIAVRLDLSIAFLKPILTPKNNLLYGVDAPEEIDLSEHFEVSESAYEQEMSFTYRVAASVDGKVKDVKVYEKNGLINYSLMSAGNYTVYVTIWVPDGETGEQRKLFDSEFAYAMTLYNSAGQAYNPESGDSPKPWFADKPWLKVALWISGAFLILAAAVVTIIIIVKKKRRKTAE
jgi:hypothetical protein